MTLNRIYKMRALTTKRKREVILYHSWQHVKNHMTSEVQGRLLQIGVVVFLLIVALFL